MFKKILSLCCVFVFMFFVGALSVSAAAGSLSGWAWSDNIGWISFSSVDCTDGHTGCPPVVATAYGVNSSSSGDLTGYAWSDNIGWIQFGSLSGFPSGSGTQAVNAQINGNNFKGWIRAVSQIGKTDGWDGWISLSGAGPSYGPSLNASNQAEGYAWGSDVVGWVRFDPISSTNTIYPPVTFGPTTYSCVGGFANASLCSGDNTGLTGNTSITLVPSCTPAVMCEQTCNTGYEISNNGTSCVQTVSATDCAGPDGSAIAVGSSKKYFQKSRVAADQTCVSEVRTCSDPVDDPDLGPQLSAGNGYMFTSCIVSPDFKPF